MAATENGIANRPGRGKVAKEKCRDKRSKANDKRIAM